MQAALQTGELDAFLFPLHELPTAQPEGLAITAVSQRADPAAWLILPAQYTVDNQLFKLKNGARVGASSALERAQMLHFRPDAIVENTGPDLEANLEMMRAGGLDALLANAAQLQSLPLDDFFMVKFNPVEFVPAPGQGVWAYCCCAGDLETRRALRLLHHPAVSAATNIERKVLKMLGGQQDLALGTFCEIDAAGHYHAHAVMAPGEGQPLRRTRLSQNTHLSLVENIVKALTD
jgi:hydroxymethylbilane synthase